MIDPGNVDVKRALVTLDADVTAVSEAIENDCQMIISHHPIIYSAIRSLNASDGEQRNYIKLIQNGIAVYSAHLSLDSVYNGINATLASEIGLTNTKPLFDLGGGSGLMFSGNFSGNMEELCKRLSEITCAPMRVSFNTGNEPLKVAVVNGGGADVEMMQRAKNAGYNTLISGDAKFHAFVWAKNNGFNLVDAGHFETEIFYLDRFVDALKKGCVGVTFLTGSKAAPYTVYGGKS